MPSERRRGPQRRLSAWERSARDGLRSLFHRGPLQQVVSAEGPHPINGMVRTLCEVCLGHASCLLVETETPHAMGLGRARSSIWQTLELQSASLALAREVLYEFRPVVARPQALGKIWSSPSENLSHELRKSSRSVLWRARLERHGRGAVRGSRGLRSHPSDQQPPPPGRGVAAPACFLVGTCTRLVKARESTLRRRSAAEMRICSRAREAGRDFRRRSASTSVRYAPAARLCICV